MDSRRDLLSMYLPQEAHKSFTTAFVDLGGELSKGQIQSPPKIEIQANLDFISKK